MTALHTLYESPVGALTLVADDEVLTGVYFSRHWYRPDPSSFGPLVPGALADVRRQLDEYFAGERRLLDVPVRASGDEFQQRVWKLIDGIGYGGGLERKRFLLDLERGDERLF